MATFDDWIDSKGDFAAIMPRLEFSDKRTCCRFSASLFYERQKRATDGCLFRGPKRDGRRSSDETNGTETPCVCRSPHKFYRCALMD